jgi:hypothetical protein
MPITFHFRPEHNLAICTHIGTIGDEEFLASYNSFLRNSDFTTAMNLVVDLSRADSSERSQLVLQNLAAIAKEKLSGIPARPMIAVIAPQNVSFGLARMYEAFADMIPWDFAVFRTAEEALAWLRLPEDFLDESGEK